MEIDRCNGKKRCFLFVAMAVSPQVPVPTEADAPAHPDVPDGDDEAQEGQEPRQAPRGRRRQRVLHVLPPGEVRETSCRLSKGIGRARCLAAAVVPEPWLVDGGLLKS